jgi:hypothetical protein
MMPSRPRLKEEMRNRPAEEFLESARYCLMLAELTEDRDIRDHLVQLVRAWLAAAKETEGRALAALAIRAIPSCAAGHDPPSSMGLTAEPLALRRLGASACACGW